MMESDHLWRQSLLIRNLLVREMQAGLTATAALDLSVAQSVALFQIAEAGPLTIAALQKRLNRSQSATSQIVLQLDRKGLVVRESDPADGRRTLVRLHEGGQRLIGQIQALRREGFDTAVGRLPPEVVAQLASALDAVITALSEESP